MFIDIHHHLIHGVDDGPKTFEATQKMILASKKDKVRHIIATSHAMPGRSEFPMQTYLEHLKMAQDWCAENAIPIAIHPGAEIMYNDSAVRMLDHNRIPTLCGGPYVLVEFFPSDPYKLLCQAALRLGNAGYIPIFAHVERYDCLKHLDQIQSLREEYQVQIQVNARTLLMRQGFFQLRNLKKMIRTGLVDYLATDSHNTDSRKTCLRACRAKAEEWFEDSLLDQLMYENALDILRS